jgi:cytochrome c5
MMIPRFCLLLWGIEALAQQTPGLLATYREGSLQRRLVVATPNFFLDPGEALHPAFTPAARAEWSGTISILGTGRYEFDPPVEIDGASGPGFLLTAGRHAFRLRHTTGNQLRLRWKSSTFDWEPVPPSAFSHEKQAPDAAEEGRLLVEQARCANCHPAGSRRQPAPPLDIAGTRVNKNWMYTWVGRHFIRLTPEQQAGITAFLLSGPVGAARSRRVSEVEVGKGGELIGTLGCQNCHVLLGMGSKYTLASLTDFLLNGHEPSMLLSEGDATAIAANLLRSTDPSFEKAAPTGDVARGETLVKSGGCLGCHGDGIAAQPLSKLRHGECKLVHVAWSAEQRRAVEAYLAGPPDRSPAPVYDLPHRLARHRCNNCHKAGAEAPPLEGIGEKLKTRWIGEVLWGKRRIRTGRELRMPNYRREEMEAWVTSFAKAEGLPPGDGPAPPVFTEEARYRGMGWLGTNPRRQGMACIGCHDWGENKALGEEGPQLINATERLRFDWFERWMRNPARILSGTSMPNYFGSIPAERARERIHTLWAGMDRGPTGPVPDGYLAGDVAASAEAKPVAGKEAVVVRWDMPEATPAAIAVALPGGLSYCFDAGRSQVLYAWSGGFIDLTGTLLRKVDKNRLTPTAALIGEMVYHSAGFPIRTGTPDHVPQVRFRGYRLIGGIPEFMYEVDGIAVREMLAPEGKTIRRQLVFSRVRGSVWFEGKNVPDGDNVKVEVFIGQ